MCHENIQVELEFGFGRIIFCRVMSLGLRQIPIMGHKNTQIKSDMVLFELFSAMACTLHLCMFVLGNF